MAEHRLETGRIRRLLPWETRRLRAHLLRLDPEARRARFGGQVKDRAIVRFVTELDRKQCVSIGYFERGALRGSIQLVRHPQQWFEGAELSLAVERDWRGRGIGGAMLARAVAEARRRGIRSLYLSSMRDNDAVLALARRLGAEVETRGAVEGVVHLPPPRAPRPRGVRLAIAWRRLMRRLQIPRPAAG